LRQLHAIVRGRVQGVSFRYNAQHAARRLDLMGWVRNLPDGTVETLAQGDEARLQQYEAWLQHGPQGAVVTAVDTQWSDMSSPYNSFEILYGTD
jgi:acylphosphatase